MGSWWYLKASSLFSTQQPVGHNARLCAGIPSLEFWKISGQISSIHKSLVDNRMGNNLLMAWLSVLVHLWSSCLLSWWCFPQPSQNKSGVYITFGWMSPLISYHRSIQRGDRPVGKSGSHKLFWKQIFKVGFLKMGPTARLFRPKDQKVNG